MKTKSTWVLLFLFSIKIYAQEIQPFAFKIKTLQQTLEHLGSPILKEDAEKIEAIIKMNDEGAVEEIKKIIDNYALFEVVINPESRVSISQGIAQPELQQNGWHTFLVKVDNQARITAKFQINSPQSKLTYDGGEKIYGMGGAGKGMEVSKGDIADRCLDLSLYTQNPMQANLSGLETDYFIVQIYSRDYGKRAAKFSFNCGEATQDIGFRNEASIMFECKKAASVKLEIIDENKIPTTISLTIKDKYNHIYPSQVKRLAPDFFFQPQIYRTDGEKLELPFGNYIIEYGRGPEYLIKKINFTVNETTKSLKLNLERWINPNEYGWYSGDHHIHAAGCSHYTSPTQGVNPEDMIRHIKGEGLNVGSVLIWGPGYYHQKQFFEGKDNKLSSKENLLRYDLEISGFPSGHSGHLVLLRLKDQNYPNCKALEDWPTYTIPVLKWAKSQGAITGYAHSGLGLEVKNDSLPNYELPKFDGIGANEYIVAVTQNLVDFISTMDTPAPWELNIWYHTLNCGFRTRISGETDFPCMSDEKVGHGRSYVKMDKKLNFADFAEGLKMGKTYVSEGKSHILNFKVNDVEVGVGNSEMNLDKPKLVKVTAKVAAFLNETIDPEIKPLNVKENVWTQKPFWNLERARIGKTRTVGLELIVNGEVVETKNILADGSLQDIKFETKIEKSSWVALRILPSSHTNPIFVLVDKKNIRANLKSAEWCLKAVDVCWESKKGNISNKEIETAKSDYNAAKLLYQKILLESKNE